MQQNYLGRLLKKSEVLISPDMVIGHAWKSFKLVHLLIFKMKCILRKMLKKYTIFLIWFIAELNYNHET